MPIVISRTGPVEPRNTSPLTQAQQDALWEHIVRSWCDKNLDRLAQLAQEDPDRKGEVYASA